MRLSLAIDTSTSRTIVGIIDGTSVLFEKSHEGATDHGRALSELVAEALKASAPPQQVVVGMGPGPFTGLRVGISFAHTFGLARNIPVIGICSLDAIDMTRVNTPWPLMHDVKRFIGRAIRMGIALKDHL